MDNKELNRDTIFDESLITTDNTSTGITLRAVSISSLSMLSKLQNPLRFLFFGQVDANIILSEDLPYIIEFVWLHAEDLEKVRALVIEGDHEKIANAVLDWAENISMYELKEYVSQLESDLQKVLLSSATRITPSKDDSKNAQSQD